MSDSLGPIPIPDPPTITDFPFTGDYTSGMDFTPKIASFVFDQPGLKTEQRYLLGPGQRRFRFFRDHLSCGDYDTLRAHFEQAQGQYAMFHYNYYSPAGRQIVFARYENPNVTFNQLVGLLASDPGITLLEVPTTTPAYTSVATVERFPDTLLTTALESQVQQMIPLITVTPRMGGFTLYISNQRCSVNGQVYLPRLASWSGIAQTMSESSDSAQFTFGNADDIFTQLVNQTSLYRATVTFSLFHVNTNYLINLWAGAARQWTMTSDGKFVLPATDGAFELTLNYPARQLSRTCWKVYKGRFCPSTADPATFPDCPKDYNSCIARGVPQSFGGVVAQPQSVHVKDNSTGVLGFGRSSITSVSIAEDTIYERSVQEVYTDENMLVTCDVAAGRDESDFYSALGIVGEGPIGGYSPNLISHTLDGQPPHDPRTGGGWRGIVGNDPAALMDYFGLDQAPWVFVPPGSTYAAGLAFAEIRRTDAVGLQLAPVADRAMSVTVSAGISGWTWTAPGARVWTAALSNSVWVAINVYLRARGLKVSPANQTDVPVAVMEQYFDVNQAIAAAAVCDLQVDKIVGTGQERQFPFRGVFKEQKALKDWLQEIMNGCLGFFTFVNGKLWIGIRTDASVLAGNAFTQANILHGSLEAKPLEPQFNWLNGQFGDEEFAWALNTVTVYDIDAAGFLGAPISPQYLKSTMSFVGISNKSQCGRVISTRIREELGGVGLQEQADARDLKFRTTLLALRTMVGDCISMTHPRLPNGESKARVTNWTLNPDFSIDLQAKAVTDLMYDLDSDVGPKPVDVPADPVPPELLQSATGLAWMPDHIGPFGGDPIYTDPNERSFDLWQDYLITREGNWAPAIWVSGEKVINQFAPVQPRILNMVMVSGGNISGPLTLYVAVTQSGASGAPSAPSNLYALWVPAGVNNQGFTLTLAAAPSGTWYGWDLYAGTDRRRMALQLSSVSNLPVSFTFTGPLSTMTRQLPDGAARAVEIKAKHVFHSGIAGVLIANVIGLNQIQSNEFIGASASWVNRIVSALADASDGSAPLWNFTITAFDPATGTMTVSPNCVIPGDPGNSVEKGDVLIIRSIATSSGPNWVEDTMWNNPIALEQYNSPGLSPDAEKGRIYRILRGTGAGQFRHILGNTAIRITVDTPWTTQPDATSIGIVEAADWDYFSETSEGAVPAPGNPFELRLRVDNLADEVALVGGFLVDDNGNLTDEEVAVYREIYIFGEPPGVREVGPDPGPWVSLPTDQTINVVATIEDVVVQLINLAEYQGRTLYVANGDGPYNAVVVCADGEFLFDGLSSVTLGPHETVTVTSG